MAVTKIHAIKTTLNKALDYIENPDKTEGQLLVSGYNVDPLSASIEYEMTAALAKEIKGNYSKTGGANNLAYHMIQSFAPTDNVTPEQAHEIGKKLADEFLDGKYEYVIATHIDQGHIHNHIIFNAVSFYDFKKMNTQPYKTAAKIRAISDRLCSENELSVIKEKGNLAYSYTEYKARKKNTSWKSEIRKRLKYILETATEFEELKINAAALGVTVDDSGKHIKYRIEGQERFARGNKLSDTDKYVKEGIIGQLASNKSNQEFIKNSIGEIAKKANSYDSFVDLMKERFSITIKKEKSGNIVYKLDDMDGSKVKEKALGTAYSAEEIKEAIKNQNFDFIEPAQDINIADEYNNSVRTKVEEVDTRILLSDKNISKITVEGILIEMPDTAGNIGKVFINNDHVNYIEQSHEYEIFIGDKYDYYFVNETVNPDILESEQLTSKYTKGEYLIRTLEKLNDVKPAILDIAAADIKALSPKGITISLPDMGIDSFFIENEYVTYDRENGSCKVQLYENWNYNFRKTDKEKDSKNLLNNIKGRDIIGMLTKREAIENQSLVGRIAALEKRNQIADTKALAETLVLIRRESISSEPDFDIRIKELQATAGEIKETIKTLESKNEQYKNATKYLLTFNKYLTIKQELEKQSFISKNKFAKLHESELLAFEHAATQLEKLGVNTNVDSDKVVNLIKDQNRRAKDLSGNFKEVDNRINELKKAQAMVNEMINPQRGESKKQEKKQDQEL
ncbi:MAG: relaxase/mobilization nuclease domain-containing protein [Oscillospiraceae bacterium]